MKGFLVKIVGRDMRFVNCIKNVPCAFGRFNSCPWDTNGGYFSSSRWSNSSYYFNIHDCLKKNSKTDDFRGLFEEESMAFDFCFRCHSVAMILESRSLGFLWNHTGRPIHHFSHFDFRILLIFFHIMASRFFLKRFTFSLLSAFWICYLKNGSIIS